MFSISLIAPAMTACISSWLKPEPGMVAAAYRGIACSALCWQRYPSFWSSGSLTQGLTGATYLNWTMFSKPIFSKAGLKKAALRPFLPRRRAPVRVCQPCQVDSGQDLCRLTFVCEFAISFEPITATPLDPVGRLDVNDELADVLD